MRRPVLLALCCALLIAVALPGCGKQKVLLESEKRLAGMYKACQNIDIVDPPKSTKVAVSSFSTMPQQSVDAVLKRSNGMKISGTWAGVKLSDVLAANGVTTPFRELKISAYDGYVGRVSYDIAMRPDTLIANKEGGKPLPRDEGPVRLVVASQDGFYWINMITKIEVLR
jgi:DMSO/TMAO reductase YedYZ molybdopterin-dependent catalytic subunit